MNHVYRTVFNRARGIYQVASELARNAGGGGSTSVVGAAVDVRVGSAPGALRIGVLAALAVCTPLAGFAQVIQYGTSGAGVAGIPVGGGSTRYGSGSGGIGGGGGGGSSFPQGSGDGGAGGGTGAGAGGPGLGNGSNATTADSVRGNNVTLSVNTNATAIYIGGSGGGGRGANGTTSGTAGGSGQDATLTLGAGRTLTVSGELRVGGAGGGAGSGANQGSTGGAGGKGGAGTLVLGNNTVVNVGSLQVGGTAGNVGQTRSGAVGAAGAGTLQLNGTGSLTAANGIAISSTGTIAGTQTAGNTFTLTGNITGAGKLTQTGAGTTVLLGNVSHTGGTTISAGTLQLGSGGAAGNFAGNITNNSKLVVNGNNPVTLGGIVSGTGTLTQSGSGTTTLTGLNTYSGGTTVANGTLALSGTGQLAATGAMTLANTGTKFDISAASGDRTVGSLTTATGSTVTLGARTLTFGTAASTSVDGVIAGSGGVIKQGAGTATFGAANAYAGGTTVQAGRIALSGTGSLASSGAVTLAGGSSRFDIGAANGNRTIGALSGVAGSNVALGTRVLTFGDATNQTFAGTLTGTANTAGIVKEGGGTTTLTGANSYTGTTTINAGTLAVGNGGTTGSLGNGNIVNNASLVFNRGTGQLTVANTISGTGALTFMGGSNYLVTANNSNSGGINIVGGAVQLGDGGTTGTFGAGAIVDNGVLIYYRSNGHTVGNAVSGSGAVVVAGAGTATFTGSNSYAGATQIGASGLTGAVRVGNGANSGTLGAGNVVFAVAGSTLAFNRSDALSVGNDISGDGSVTQAGNGTTTLTGNNSYTRTTTISNGTLQVGAGGASGTLGTGNVVNNASLVFNRSGALTVGGVISGTGRVTQVGSGTTTLTNANSYSGGTTVQAGTLALGSAGTLAATGALNLSGSGAKFDISAATGGIRTIGALSGVTGTTIALGANALTFGNANNQSFAGVIGGTGGIVRQGGGVTTLSGNNTYTGATTVSAGTLRMGVANALGNTTAVSLTNVAGVSLDLDGFNQSIGSLAGGGNVNLGAGSLSLGSNNTSTSYAGVISGTGAVTKLGTGTQTFSAANTYTGGTTVQSGTLALSGAGNLAASAAVALTGAGASFDISAANADRTIGALSGAASSTVALGARTLSFGDTTNQVVGSTISGTGGLVKQFSGTTSLTGANTYTGLTTINAGTLAINGSVAGGVLANNGGTLGGSGSIGGDVTVGKGATLSAGNSPGTLTVAGNLTLSAGSTSVFELGQSGAVGGTSNDLVSVGGNLTLGGALQATASSAGFYRLFNYGVTNPAATLAGSFDTTSVTGVGGFNAASQQISSTAASAGNPGQVNLSVLGAGQSLQFWNGSASKAGSGLVGGSGTWSGFGSNWTDAQGNTATNWLGSVAVFAGPAGGAVTVQGPQSFDTMQFSTDGYSLVAGTNGTLGLAPSTGTRGTINTDAGIGASIAAAIVNGPGAGNALVKVGSGTLTLSGANTYTGGTTVNEGLLVAASDGALGTGAAVVDNTLAHGATLQVDKGVSLSNAITLNNGGTLDNAGAVSVAGLAVQSQTGSATVLNRTGGTITGALAGVLLQNGGSVTNEVGATIGGGLFAVQANGATTLSNAGTLQGNVLLDAQAAHAVTLQTTGQIVGDLAIGNATSTLTLETDAASRLQSQAVTGTTTFAGVLAKTGTGTWVLDSDLAAARTTIAGGTLQLGNGGTTGTVGDGAITNNATLAVDRSDAIALAGAIDGTGNLVKQGAGTLALTGANSYEGGTALKQGRIDLGHNQALGTGELAMDDGTALGFTVDGLVIGNAIRMTGNNDPVIDTGAFSETLSGVISGAGFLTKDGTGKLTLTGDNTYTGTTTINAGTLQIGNGGTTGTLGTGAVTNLGALVFDRSDALAVANAIGGTGSLAQNGSGTLTLSGVNTYAGATLVNAGTLRAGAANTFSAGSAHTVAAGATLDLAGFNQTVAGVTSAGTVSLRGSTPGTVLTVTGPWVGQGGTLAVGTALAGNGSASDKLLLSGASAVASGTTALQVTNLGGLGGQTTGSGIAVVSTENGASVQGNAFTLATPVAAGAYEYRLNTDAGGAYLSSTSTTPVPGGSATPSPTASGTPLYRAEVPLLAALPEQLRQANLAMLGNMHQRMGDHGARTAEHGTRQAWGRILTVDRTLQQRGTVSPSSEGRLTGFQAGTDLWATQDWRAGVYVGRLEGDMKVGGFARGIAGYAAGSNDLKNDYLGGYVGYRADSGLYLDGVLQAGRHRTAIGTLGALAGSNKGSSLLASIEMGQAFALGAGWSLEPQLQLVHQRLSLDDTALVGATVQQDTDKGWAVRAGLRIKGEFATGAGTVQPYARLNVWRTGSGTDRARFIGPAASTDVLTSTGGTSTEAALGAHWQITPSVGVYGELGQLWASGGSARTKGGPNASLGVKVRW